MLLVMVFEDELFYPLVKMSVEEDNHWTQACGHKTVHVSLLRLQYLRYRYLKGPTASSHVSSANFFNPDNDVCL